LIASQQRNLGRRNRLAEREQIQAGR